MSSFAVSTKYLSIPSLLIVGALIAWSPVEDSTQPLKMAFSNLLQFGLSAVVTSGTWYLKSWLWTVNPVYPLIFDLSVDVSHI